MKNHKQTLLNSWKNLKNIENLELALIKGECEATGIYQGYQIKFETFTLKEGSPQNIRLYLFGDKFLEQVSLTKSSPPLSEQALTKLFSITSSESAYFLHGNTTFTKKALVYEQTQVELSVDFLHFLLSHFVPIIEAYSSLISLGQQDTTPLEKFIHYYQHPMKGVVIALLYDINKWHIIYTWETLKDTYNLKIQIAKGECQAVGMYQDYHFKFETFSDFEDHIEMQEALLYNIRLTFFGNAVSKTLALESPPQKKIPLTEVDITRLFSTTNPQESYFLQGKTLIKPGYIVYQTLKAKPHTPLLQFLFEQHCVLLEAYPHIVAWGSEAVPLLEPIVNDKEHPFNHVAVSLLEAITLDTTTRLGQRLEDFLCARCLTYMQRYTTTALGENTTYYGCRTCAQSQDLYEVSYVVAALDNKSETEVSQRGKVTHINWLLRRRLFDFDMIEFIHATDEDVERFLVQIGNDTDPTRKARYKQMHYLIGPECDLSPNTLKILQEIFGEKD